MTGQIFIVCAPSGGGKTSLTQALVKSLDHIEISISHTTRDQRPGEHEGVHYFFVSDQTFNDMIAADAFVEHAAVYDHQYGTSVPQLMARLEQGIDVVLDIDWQGAQQIRRRFPEAISVFILPPSIEVLRHRLSHRGRENDESIQQRLMHAQADMQHFQEFDYLIINHDFDKALQTLTAIVLAARTKTQQQIDNQQALLASLALL